MVAAALVIGAMAAATASATEPIFERVVVLPVKEGEKINFTSVIGKATIETVAKAKVACLSGSNKGSITGPTSISFSITFKGCEEALTKCTSTGAAEGEIVTNEFEGKLGNLKSNSTPGVAVTQSKLKANDAEFLCGATKVKLFGGVVGPITAVGSVVTKLTLSYKATAGIQLFESLFGGPLDVLSATFGEGTAEQTGLTATDRLTLTEPIEVT